MKSHYSPWDDLAAREELTFGVTRLPSGDAWWLPSRRAIVLDDRLSRVERRCALAHELAHVDHEDICTRANPRVDEKQEKHADQTAARRLIELDDLIDALKWSRDPWEVATDLEVTIHYARVRLHIATTHPTERTYFYEQLATEGDA